jgi:Family of unknown function (DUF6370)
MNVLPVLLFVAASAVGSAQTRPAQVVPAQASATVPGDTLLVEAACGQCRLGLPGKSCDLAVRVGGQAYFVTGTGIDGHGDAHAQDGFCNAIRQARVLGTIVDGRFNVRYFQLLPAPAAAAPTTKP